MSRFHVCFEIELPLAASEIMWIISIFFSGSMIKDSSGWIRLVNWLFSSKSILVLIFIRGWNKLSLASKSRFSSKFSSLFTDGISENMNNNEFLPGRYTDFTFEAESGSLRGEERWLLCKTLMVSVIYHWIHVEKLKIICLNHFC